jgi:acetyltransferase-like isoleucine patch superfamily enzyme
MQAFIRDEAEGRVTPWHRDPTISVHATTRVASGVKIGRYSSIGGLCTIGAEHHDYNRFTTWGFSEVLETSIGPDVWIGCNVSVLSGINIGTGAVIGAGSTVVIDIPPYAIAYGVPAKVHKYRFTQDIIEALLKSKWWELPEEVVRTFSPDPAIMLSEKERYHDSNNA